MLIFAILGFGVLVGAAAQFLLGRHGRGIDWGMAIIAGIAGSFIGGLLASLIAGDGLKLRPSGFIGSILGAVIITAIWRVLPQPPVPAAGREGRRPRRGGPQEAAALRVAYSAARTCQVDASASAAIVDSPITGVAG